MQPAQPPDRSRAEWLAVAVVTILGAVLRLWPMGRLGLTHFDEGIYAMVASWSMQAGGPAAIDPILIPYAPPGYPILGGLAYAILGRSDSAMIAVSQMAGTLTIPVVAWLAWRTFGPGSGFVAAVFCACSGPHIAYSRMALTDASFLLVWLLALVSGIRFLERPGLIRAVVLGLAVGLAQQFKYNGWLSGGIVIGSAVWGLILWPEERKLGAIARTFGWGLLAVVLASGVVWPWFRFVEGHGGYSALLRHQQSYLGGFDAWWPNFRSQAAQAVAMSGDTWLTVAGLGLACLTPLIARPTPWFAATSIHSLASKIGLAIGLGCLPWLMVSAPYRLGLVVLPWLFVQVGSGVRLLGVCWFVLMVMTPFYHPYSRLWLPFHAVNWILIGVVVAQGIRVKSPERDSVLVASRSRVFLLSTYGVFALGGIVFLASTARQDPTGWPGLLDPSDSLRQACLEVSASLPEEVDGLRLLVRPPVTYYLAGRVALYPSPGSSALLKPGPSRLWALVDSAILRSELGRPLDGPDRILLDRFANQWELVREVPTNLSWPTLLDLDPDAAKTATGPADRSSPLWLLRPRRPGVHH